MGAQLSTVAPTATVPIDAYVAELGDLTYSGDMGRGSRFLKTVRALHRDGHAVIKVFIKPPALIVDLVPARQALQTLSTKLRPVSNAIGYKRIVETDRAGYLVRQYIKHNLYDRISTRPFLEHGEKVWLAYQLLRCLDECHASGIYHGDIKSENVLVNSWKWVYVVDFAPYKPVWLPETDTAPFLFYFDTSQRRTCYVAPERFGDSLGFEEGALTAEMDVYSAGCVIAELFLDGTPLFTLADLVKYKRGEHTPDLAGINDPLVRDLIEGMISLDPQKRLSAHDSLAKFRTSLFPPSFDALYDLLAPLSGSTADSDDMVRTVWKEFNHILSFMHAPQPQSVSSQVPLEVLPVRVQVPGVGDGTWVPTPTDLEDRTPALLVLSLVCSTLRSTESLQWRLRAAELVLALSALVGDEARLDRCLPYLMGLVRDEYDSVRELGLACVTHLLDMTNNLTPLNDKVYSEYVFPRLSSISSSSPSVRAVWAACLPRLAVLAARWEDDSVLTHIDEAARSLLVDKHASVRRRLLEHAAPLCAMLGRQRTNDLVLSHAITYLNDKDPQVREDLFSFVAKVAPLVGPASLEQYVVPLMIQSLTDPYEDVVASVLQALAALCELGLVRERLLLGTLIPSITKFLVHPNPYIRVHVVLVIVQSARQLDKAQVWCLLRPHVLPFLEQDISDYSNHAALVEALRPPVALAVYNLARRWAIQARKSAFWTSTSATTTSFSVEDKRWLARLRDVGFNNEDLWQLLAFRDYLSQLPPETLGTLSPPQSEQLGSPTVLDDEGEDTQPPEYLAAYVKSHKSRSKNAKPVGFVTINGKDIAHNGPLSTANDSTTTPNSESRPPLVLVTSIKAHRGTVAALTVAINKQTFATGADDGLVKIWDARSLARGASRPVLTYDAGTKVTCLLFLGHVLVIGTMNGGIQFVNVECHTSETGQLVYESVSLIDKVDGNSPVVSIHLLDHPILPVLLVLRANCTLSHLDLGTLAITKTLRNPSEYGPPTCWAFDPTGDWVAVGTSHGMISLWDLRFSIRVAQWGVGELCPLTAMVLHPNNPHWICVAGGYTRPWITVWDVQRVECREVLLPASDGPEGVPLEPLTSDLGQRFADWRFDTAEPQLPVTTLASGTPNVIVSGGGDHILRYWDLLSPNRCGVVSGLLHTQPRPTYTARIGANTRFIYERPGTARRPERQARTVVIANEEADIGRNHRGTITRVALLAGQQREMLVSVDEVGVVKVFV